MLSPLERDPGACFEAFVYLNDRDSLVLCGWPQDQALTHPSLVDFLKSINALVYQRTFISGPEIFVFFATKGDAVSAWTDWEREVAGHVIRFFPGRPARALDPHRESFAKSLSSTERVWLRHELDRDSTSFAPSQILASDSEHRERFGLLSAAAAISFTLVAQSPPSAPPVAAPKPAVAAVDPSTPAQTVSAQSQASQTLITPPDSSARDVSPSEAEAAQRCLATQPEASGSVITASLALQAATSSEPSVSRDRESASSHAPEAATHASEDLASGQAPSREPGAGHHSAAPSTATVSPADPSPTLPAAPPPPSSPPPPPPPPTETQASPLRAPSASGPPDLHDPSPPPEGGDGPAGTDAEHRAPLFEQRNDENRAIEPDVTPQGGRSTERSAPERGDADSRNRRNNGWTGRQGGGKKRRRDKQRRSNGGGGDAEHVVPRSPTPPPRPPPPQRPGTTPRRSLSPWSRSPRDRSPFPRDRRGRSPFPRGRSPFPRDRSPFPRDRRGRSPLPRGRSPFPRDRSPFPRDRSPRGRSGSNRREAMQRRERKKAVPLPDVKPVPQLPPLAKSNWHRLRDDTNRPSIIPVDLKDPFMGMSFSFRRLDRRIINWTNEGEVYDFLEYVLGWRLATQVTRVMVDPFYEFKHASVHLIPFSSLVKDALCRQAAELEARANHYRIAQP